MKTLTKCIGVMALIVTLASCLPHPPAPPRPPHPHGR